MFFTQKVGIYRMDLKICPRYSQEIHIASFPYCVIH